MLTRIKINNLALIRDLEIDFTGNLNVFSGETGAGKSIIIDSLMLLIGARYDKTMLKFGEEKGYVEGCFEVSDAKLLEDAGIDAEDGIMIVSRRFNKDGKNDIRVNGKQLTTSMLRELMTAFVDIYGQNEFQSLLKQTEQRKILDHFVFGKNTAAVDEVKSLYFEHKRLLDELRSLGDEEERARRIDILKYQIDEIARANIAENEEHQLLDRRHILMSSERIKNALADCADRLDSDEGALTLVADAARSLSGVSGLGDAYSALHDRLRSVSIELDDISSCIKDELESMDGSERELDELTSRLELIRALKNKYGVVSAMNEFAVRAKSELKRLENGAQEYEQLCVKQEKLRKKLFDSCAQLSRLRRDGAKKLEKRIVEELSDLGMEKSRFEVSFADMPDIDTFLQKVNANGFDDFEFYLSPNPGQPLMPLAKIISGGEMSRFMLAIKLITGDLGEIDTFVFDEIDAGISGVVGQSVAKKLCELSRTKQVLCVTHLPQIAAMADSHFYIEKTQNGGETQTNLSLLTREGQIGEISRLSGSKGVSSTADKNAEELKLWSDNYKASLR